MNTETSTAQTLRVAGKKAKYDAAAKRLLADKHILALILKTSVKEFRNCSVRKIAETYIEGNPEISETSVHPDEFNPLVAGLDTADKSIHEGTVFYDIRFRVLLPDGSAKVSMIVNVEAQNKHNPGYPLITRAIYYCARMLSSQYGTEFSGSHYEKLKKVCSIWICTNAPEAIQNTITGYQITSFPIEGITHEPEENYDLLTILMICLGEPGQETDKGGILTLLNTLFSDRADLEEKRRVLEEDYGLPMTEWIETEVREMCNLSEGIWEKAKEEQEIINLKTLMHKFKISLEEAMDILDVPGNRRSIYRKMTVFD